VSLKFHSSQLGFSFYHLENEGYYSHKILGIKQCNVGADAWVVVFQFKEEKACRFHNKKSLQTLGHNVMFET
jgi:hypothetical protein